MRPFYIIQSLEFHSPPELTPSLLVKHIIPMFWKQSGGSINGEGIPLFDFYFENLPSKNFWSSLMKANNFAKGMSFVFGLVKKFLLNISLLKG
jgi:hypothetical protein